MYLAKTKVLISCAITLQLICAFLFAYAKSRFFYDVAHVSYIEDIILEWSFHMKFIKQAFSEFDKFHMK